MNGRHMQRDWFPYAVAAAAAIAIAVGLGCLVCGLADCATRTDTKMTHFASTDLQFCGAI